MLFGCWWSTRYLGSLLINPNLVHALFFHSLFPTHTKQGELINNNNRNRLAVFFIPGVGFFTGDQAPELGLKLLNLHFSTSEADNYGGEKHTWELDSTMQRSLHRNALGEGRLHREKVVFSLPWKHFFLLMLALLVFFPSSFPQFFFPEMCCQEELFPCGSHLQRTRQGRRQESGNPIVSPLKARTKHNSSIKNAVLLCINHFLHFSPFFYLRLLALSSFKAAYITCFFFLK